MNANRITADDWSNPASAELYRSKWPAEPGTRAHYEYGEQCGGCSFFAPFDADFGLCCHAGSRHRLETVFEHFTCPAYAGEGWGPHSFTVEEEFHCKCGGSR
jgi:hypothetical protein